MITENDERRLRMLRANLLRARAAGQIRAELNKVREITAICDASGVSSEKWLAPDTKMEGM